MKTFMRILLDISLNVGVLFFIMSILQFSYVCVKRDVEVVHEHIGFVYLIASVVMLAVYWISYLINLLIGSGLL